MSKMNFTPSKTGFMTGKGFYVALAVCLIAVGAASFIAIRSITDTPDSLELQSEFASRPESSGALEAGQNVSGATGSKPAKASSANASSKNADSSAVSSKKPVASYFIIPVSGEVIKGFSDTELQYSKTYCDWRYHAAIDIAAKDKDPVRSAGDGTVLEVKDDALLGVTVIIDHGNGVTAHYSGLSANPPVKKGDTVESGETIAYIGKIPCEVMDGHHLHFGMAKDGKWVSPLKLMGLLEDSE